MNISLAIFLISPAVTFSSFFKFASGVNIGFLKIICSAKNDARLLEFSKEILAVLKTFETPDFDFEIHADIGEKGETRTMIQEVVGMIRANNFEARTKPESYAASNVADRHV